MPHLLDRRTLLNTLLGLSAAHLLTESALAADYPDKPIKFIVPFSAGGHADSVGRLMATAMGPFLNQSVVVENRAGAGGSLGAGMVAQGTPDGYTLLIGSNGPLTVNPFVQAKIAYDSLKDFATIALVGYVPHVLMVKQDLPPKTLQELVAYSKREAVGCGSAGVGSATHLTLERFNAQTGSRLMHVPYRGGSSMVPDLLGGTVPVACIEFSTALPLHKSGKARILGLAGTRRSSMATDVPTFIEGGVSDFTAHSYVGLLAPARTPEAALRKLEAAAAAVLATSEIADSLRSLGMEVATQSERLPAGFAEFLRADYARSRAAVQLAGIKPN